MTHQDKSLLEKALRVWIDSQKVPYRALGISEDTIAMAEKSAEAYLNGNIKQGMRLAVKSNAKGVAEVHQAAFRAVVDTLTEITTISSPPPKIPSFDKATPRERVRWYGQ